MTFYKKLLDHPVIQYLVRLFNNISDDYIGLLAAGVAFYFFLAAFPAIGALISLYGLFSDPVFIQDQMQNLTPFLPHQSLKILSDQAVSISSTSSTALSLGLVVGLLLAIYSSTKGVSALMAGLNVAYNEKEKRNFLIFNYTAYVLTFVVIVYFLFSLSLIAFMPAFFSMIHMPPDITRPLLLLRWPLLMFSAMIGLQMIYNYGPSHSGRKRKFLSWGAVVATLFWLGGSSLFSLFVSNFGKYNETYGSLGAVAVLLLWFWLNALTVLLGAEVNAAFHPRTVHRTDLHLTEQKS